MGARKCRQCDGPLPEGAHRITRVCSDVCKKDRAKASSMAWYKANPEKARASSDAYRKANPEKERARKEAYQKANPEKERARYKAYRKANPEKARASSEAWNKANPEKIRAMALNRLYGITQDEYDTMHETQGGLCLICDKPQKVRRLAVDHCHTTGDVRGLLCISCNNQLGVIEKDPAKFHRMIDYIEEHKK